MKKLSREELLQLVTKICEVSYNTEEELEAAIELLESNVLDPYISDYIFNHKPELTPEEIVEKALSYKPICF